MMIVTYIMMIQLIQLQKAEIKTHVDAYKTAETWEQYADYIEGYDFE